MLKLKSIWHGSLFLIAFMMILSGAVIQLVQNDSAIAQTNTQATSSICGANSTFTSIHEGSVLNGPVSLDFYSSALASGTVTNISKVEFYTNHYYIAKVTHSNTGKWSADWDTTLFNNEIVAVSARLFDANNNLLCSTMPTSVTIQNDVTPVGTNQPPAITKTFKLKKVEPLVSSWTGTTQIHKSFEVDAFFNDGTTTSRVNSQTQFNWRLEPAGLGELKFPDADHVDFFTGPDVGTTTLVITASFSTFSDVLRYNVIIKPSTTSTYPIITNPTDTSTAKTGEPGTTNAVTGTDGSTVSNSTSSTTGAIDSSTTTTIGTSSPPELATSDPKLTNCMVEVIGQSAYDGLSDGKKRLTFKQLNLVKRCFAESRYVLPANVAPVDPQEIVSVKEDNQIAKVNEVSQVEPNLLDNNTSSKGILLSGTSLPNTTIVLYIYSEPLVLTTTTDAQGNWSYILEDPLVAGDHEVYVVVEGQDGTPVRSSAFKFSVAESASIDTNPTGLSLVLNLSGSESNATIYYVSAVASIILVGSGVFIFLLRRKEQPPEIDNTSHDSLYS